MIVLSAALPARGRVLLAAAAGGSFGRRLLLQSLLILRSAEGGGGGRGICSAQCRGGEGATATVGSSMMSQKEPQVHEIGDWYSVPDLSLRDHRFAVPLDYSSPDGPRISVFAREVVLAGKEAQHLPYLLYLQGGPGFESPRQLKLRGTGLSTPLTVSSLMQFTSAKKLVDYVKHFRADSIVNDAEFIRVRLSYGGFCAVTYLSFAPQGLRCVLLTGGLPPIGKDCTADDVYRACFDQVVQQNEKYYKRFPEDVSAINELVIYLSEAEGGGVPLPSGGILTPRGLQNLGLVGLGSSTGFERLHYMFERAWDPILVPGAPKRISYYFLKSFESWISFDTNPLYALLHESIYCQGASSKWSAHKIRNSLDNVFDAVRAARESRPVFFTGEMVFPWVFDEMGALTHLKEAANLLSEKEDWPSLYDIDALNKNEVPVAAAVYYEDMYVNFKLSMETASQIAGIRLWITNEFMHSGSGTAGAGPRPPLGDAQGGQAFVLGLPTRPSFPFFSLYTHSNHLPLSLSLSLSLSIYLYCHQEVVLNDLLPTLLDYFFNLLFLVLGPINRHSLSLSLYYNQTFFDERDSLLQCGVGFSSFFSPSSLSLSISTTTKRHPQDVPC
ncbi:unnamed protein product [Spirodela intermedia]|uniref:Uncharacterized protein n=1 Tax=Spirodela intermedia TaxID=51605 RepID=A0A7I8IVJ3_SPIIN|nr:unnamed protein product [Spirodela intermedia]CAA6661016.1 unnamed protein product [Spirodela intermedia]